jgi:1,2-diacylglycerol 3-beta-galactosyltransferase
MSDTGGGHRAAAQAIQAAADQRYPHSFQFNLVDVFRDYTPAPFRYAPEIYPQWVNYAGGTWQLTYEMTNARARSQLSANLLYRYWRTKLRRMIADHPADLILSVHSIITRPVMKVFQEDDFRPPFMTVVTDLVSTHAFWYEPTTERCLVPTQAAYERGLYFGLQEQQLRITGLPIHPKFTTDLMSKAEARQALNLQPDLPAVLLVSGGDGMGPVLEIAQAVNQVQNPFQLLIVAGRNDKLREQLQAQAWKHPVTIFGFVDFMPKLMAACDILITKAGPATICEACMAGLPMIISGAIPGQEDGNVAYVTENQIGVYAPGPHLVASTLADWLGQERAHLMRRADRAKALARPNAVWEIADELHQLAQLGPVRIPEPRRFRMASSLAYLLSSH